MVDVIDSPRMEISGVSLTLPINNAGVGSLRGELFRRFMGMKGNDRSRVTSVNILKDLSFSVADGDRIGIIGRNGAGKTSLLRALAGIYQITEGEIRIRGRVSCLLAIGVGMDPDATGRENIRLAGIVGGVPWSELDALIKDVSEFADLGEFLDFPMRTYSSGMSMRLSFGIATWIKPDILFVDELIGVGDVLFYKKAEERLSNLLHAARILFLASHNFDVIRQFCNKALLLENGEMVSFGDVEDTFDRYLAAAETKTE